MALLAIATLSVTANTSEKKSIQRDAAQLARVARKTSANFAQEMKDASLASSKGIRKVTTRTEGKPTKYGCVVYNDLFDWYTDTYLGTVPASADAQSVMISDMVNASYGGVNVDGIYYATDYYYDEFWEEEEFIIEGYSLITEERLCYFYPDDYRLACINETYDATTNAVYGITFTEECN